MEYKHKKNKTIHEEQAAQRASLSKKQKMKAAEIENLSKLEMEMIKKNSDSQ